MRKSIVARSAILEKILDNLTIEEIFLNWLIRILICQAKLVSF
jgi:hypothetical protein